LNKKKAVFILSLLRTRVGGRVGHAELFRIKTVDFYLEIKTKCEMLYSEKQ